MWPHLIQTTAAPSICGTHSHECNKVPRCKHPRPLFHFRISSQTSESMKDLSCRKIPQDSAHRDRPAHPTAILLSKSHSTQAALRPQDHSMFLKEAYNTGDPPPWTRAPAHHGPACKEVLGMRAGGVHLLGLVVAGVWTECRLQQSLFMPPRCHPKPKNAPLTPHSPPTPFRP